MEDNNNSIPQEEQKQDAINWKGIFDTLLANWKKLFLVGAAAFVVFAALIFCVPNTYTTVVKLSPESSRKQGSMGSLASLASSMGFDLSSMSSSDALYPTMYPDIVQSPDFAVGLFDVVVRTKDGSFEGPYYDYLTEHTKVPFWMIPAKALRGGIGHIVGMFGNSIEVRDSHTASHYNLTRKQKKVSDAINKLVTCAVDKKAGIISLSIKAQDPLVCGILSDSALYHLELFITHYHTSKATNDMNYYKKLMDTAQQEYDASCQSYFKYVDEHSGLSMERYKLEQRKLEDAMQLKYNVFSTFQKSYLAAQAQVQDCKPAFVILQAPAIPAERSSPSRAKFTIAMTFLTLVIFAFFMIRQHIDWKRLLSDED